MNLRECDSIIVKCQNKVCEGEIGAGGTLGGGEKDAWRSCKLRWPSLTEAYSNYVFPSREGQARSEKQEADLLCLLVGRHEGRNAKEDSATGRLDTLIIDDHGRF